jgi:CelD/BcsL family acetyltransferase involved in cellulose biosynthesis
MQLEIIQTLEAMQTLAEEWNDLLCCCNASHVPFLRHEYLITWWQTLGGGEWPHGELFIITGRDEEGDLVGIAPLFFSRNQDGQPAMLLLGSIEISDYLDLIGRKNTLPEFIEQILDLLNSDQAPPWEVLDFYNLPDYSPTLKALQHAAEQRGWIYQQSPLQKSPYIPLPGDWDTYLASIDKKQRHEIRRKMRRAEENAVPVRWYIVGDESALEAEIEGFLGLMAQDPEKDRFLTPIMRRQMRLACQAAFKAGWLQLAFLEVGGEKAAGYLNFDYNGHIWVYNSGLNFGFRELSPGWVLLGYLLQWANERQRAAFDFMRGDEDYKYRFGAIDRVIYRAKVQRSVNP